MRSMSGCDMSMVLNDGSPFGSPMSKGCCSLWWMPAVVTMATLLSASGLIGGIHGTPFVSTAEKPQVTAFTKKGNRLVKLATFRFLNFKIEFIFFMVKRFFGLTPYVWEFREGLGRNLIESKSLEIERNFSQIDVNFNGTPEGTKIKQKGDTGKVSLNLGLQKSIGPGL